jgi:ATP-dependent Clp protease protease subunit
MINSIIPMVSDETPRGERSYDLYSKLMKERIIVLFSEVNTYEAQRIVASMLYLDYEKEEDIYFYINSPGGSVLDGLAIYDTMKALRSNVHTICMGQASSMGAFLLAGGTKGFRSVLKNSRVMIHEVSSGFQGTTSNIKVSAEEIIRLNDNLASILAENCSKDVEKLKNDIKQDHFMSAEEAVEYGICDSILEKIKYPLG